MRPKKHLSQFFLVSQNYLRKISDAVCLEEGGRLLEIGAGKGELTQFLVAKGVPIDCVEIDPQLCGILKEKFMHASNVAVICKDITALNSVLPSSIVVGNVPYHISFDILQFLIRNKTKIRRAYLTLQKEYARKLTALAGQKEYGYLSCFMQTHAKVKMLFTIPKSCFRPLPKVDSATVEIDFDPKNRLGVDNEGEFLGFVRKVFSQRRKKMSNILTSIYPKKEVKDILRSCGVSPDFRPEKIPLKEFTCLYNNLSSV